MIPTILADRGDYQIIIIQQQPLTQNVVTRQLALASSVFSNDMILTLLRVERNMKREG